MIRSNVSFRSLMSLVWLSVLLFTSQIQAGSVSGTVTADEGGLPLAGVQVTAYQYYDDYDYGSYWDVVSATLTDASGNYVIEGLDSGSYRIRFRDPSGGHITEYFNNAADLDSANDITLGISQAVTGFDAALAIASTINGTVTSQQTGLPLEDIYVTVYQWDRVEAAWHDVAWDYTDPDGNYSVGGLSTGTYRIGFFDEDYGFHIAEYYNNSPDLTSATDVPVGAAQTVTGYDAALVEKSRIAGTVTADQGGLPLAGIQVTAYQYYDDYEYGSYWDSVSTAVTEADGSYHIRGLDAGTYRIRFTDPSGGYITEYFDNATDLDTANDITVGTFQTVTGFDAALVLASKINGTITSQQSGLPLEAIYVTVYQWDPIAADWLDVAWDYTDPDGNYSVGGLPPGSYRIGFFDEYGFHIAEYYNNSPNLTSATDVPVGAAQTVTGYDAALVEKSRIAGTVTADQGGLPLEGIQVTAYQYYDDYDYGSYWDSVSTAVTAADGSYHIRGLNAGSYRIRFSDSSGGYITEYFNNAADLDTADDITVETSQTVTGFDAALVLASKINGTVTSQQTGLPLEDIYVAVYQWDPVEAGWNDVAWDYTDQNGDYSVSGLVAGTYRIGFFDGNGFHITEYYNNSSDVLSATDVLVGAAQTVIGYDAALAEKSRIAGTVTADPGGLPLRGVQVTAYRYYEDDYYGSYWDSVSSAVTAADGSYSIRGLDAGTYRIRFTDPSGGHITEFFDNAADLDSAGDITVGTSQTVTGFDAALVLASKINGTVTSQQTGLPLEDIYVALYQWNPVEAGWYAVAGDYTDPDGNYSVGGLSAGTYRIGFFDNEYGFHITEYYNNSSDVLSAADVLVGAAQTVTGYDAALAEKSHIAGTVTADPGGLPLRGIQVTAYRYYEDDYYGSYWDSVSSAVTAADGSYNIKGLDAGSYRIRFRDPSGGHITEFFNNAANLNSADDITVGISQTVTGFDAALVLASKIKGTVTSQQTGLPLEDISVKCYRWDPIAEDWYYESGDYTNPSGNYSLDGLAAGTYRIGYFDEDYGFHVTEYYNNSPTLISATDIPVAAGQTLTGYDAALAEKSRISGTVTAASGGQPLAGIQVTAYQYYDDDYYGSYWGSVSTAVTNASGVYSIGRLDAGNYRIRFRDPSESYITEYFNNAADLNSAVDITVGVSQAVSGFDAVLDPSPAPGYFEWASANGLAGEFSAPGSTPMMDGITNLLKYAFRLDPNEVAAGTSRYLSPGSGVSGLPHVSVEAGFLRVEYVRRKSSPDLTYQVEFCGSLSEEGPQGWQPAAESILPSGIDAEWERVIVYDDVSVSGGGARFGRVKVETR